MLESITTYHPLDRLLKARPELKANKESKEFLPNYNFFVEMHYKVEQTDGVSLEIKNLTGFLTNRKNKKTVFFLSGDISQEDEAKGKGKRINYLDYQSAEIKNLTDRIFAKKVDRTSTELKTDQQSLLDEILEKSLVIEQELEEFINQHQVGVLDVRNLSLPLNLPASLAVYRLMQRREELIFLLHNHDFVWENEDRKTKFDSQYPLIQELQNKICTPKIDKPNVKYIVINSNAQAALAERGIQNAEVVTDSLDFELKSPEDDLEKGPEYVNKMDEYFRNEFNIAENDILVTVSTRAVPRKTIECTIQAVRDMQVLLSSERIKTELEKKGSIPLIRGKITKDSKFVLLFCQDEDLQDNEGYFTQLQKYAADLNVNWRIVGDRIAQKPGVTKAGKQIYPLYDIYSLGFVDFPSKQEGIGNNLLEAIRARRLMPILKYLNFKSEILPYLSFFIDRGEPEDLEPLAEYTYGSRGECLTVLPAEKSLSVAEQWLGINMDIENYHKYADTNFELIKKKFDIRVVGKKYLDIVDSMVRTMSQSHKTD